MTKQDIKFIIVIVQYFQLKIIQAITGGLYNVGIWQLLIPVAVTVVSMIMGNEKPSKIRYIAIGVSGVFLIISITLIFTIYPFTNQTIVAYLGIYLISQASNFILMKRFVMSTKLNLLCIVFWIYVSGTCFTSIYFVIDAIINDQSHFDEIFLVLQEKEEIVGIQLFSCMNDILNTILLLYLMRNSLISKSSVYGIINSIFIIGQGIITQSFTNVIQYYQTVFFLFGYVLIFAERRREKQIRKQRTQKQQIKFMKAQDEDEVSKLYVDEISTYDDQHFKESIINEQDKELMDQENDRSYNVNVFIDKSDLKQRDTNQSSNNDLIY